MCRNRTILQTLKDCFVVTEKNLGCCSRNAAAQILNKIGDYWKTSMTYKILVFVILLLVFTIRYILLKFFCINLHQLK